MCHHHTLLISTNLYGTKAAVQELAGHNRGAQAVHAV
jgi:hypothetical protein